MITTTHHTGENNMRTFRMIAMLWLITAALPVCLSAQNQSQNCSTAWITTGTGDTSYSCPYNILPTTSTYSQEFSVNFFCSNTNTNTVYQNSSTTTTGTGVCAALGTNCAPYFFNYSVQNAATGTGTNEASISLQNWVVLGISYQGAGLGTCVPGTIWNYSESCDAQACPPCGSTIVMSVPELPEIPENHMTEEIIGRLDSQPSRSFGNVDFLAVIVLTV